MIDANDPAGTARWLAAYVADNGFQPNEIEAAERLAFIVSRETVTYVVDWYLGGIVLSDIDRALDKLRERGYPGPGTKGTFPVEYIVGPGDDATARDLWELRGAIDETHLDIEAMSASGDVGYGMPRPKEEG